MTFTAVNLPNCINYWLTCSPFFFFIIFFSFYIFFVVAVCSQLRQISPASARNLSSLCPSITNTIRPTFHCNQFGQMVHNARWPLSIQVRAETPTANCQMRNAKCEMPDARRHLLIPSEFQVFYIFIVCASDSLNKSSKNTIYRLLTTFSHHLEMYKENVNWAIYIELWLIFIQFLII